MCAHQAKPNESCKQWLARASLGPAELLQLLQHNCAGKLSKRGSKGGGKKLLKFSTPACLLRLLRCLAADGRSAAAPPPGFYDELRVAWRENVGGIVSSSR